MNVDTLPMRIASFMADYDPYSLMDALEHGETEGDAIIRSAYEVEAMLRDDAGSLINILKECDPVPTDLIYEIMGVVA